MAFDFARDCGYIGKEVHTQLTSLNCKVLLTCLGVALWLAAGCADRQAVPVAGAAATGATAEARSPFAGDAQPLVEALPTPLPSVPAEPDEGASASPGGADPEQAGFELEVSAIRTLLESGDFAAASRRSREVMQRLARHSRIGELRQLDAEAFMLRRQEPALRYALQSLTDSDGTRREKSIELLEQRFAESPRVVRIVLCRAMRRETEAMALAAARALRGLDEASHLPILVERARMTGSLALWAAYEEGLARLRHMISPEDLRRLSAAVSHGVFRVPIRFPGYLGDRALRDFVVLLRPGRDVAAFNKGVVPRLRFVTADGGQMLGHEVQPGEAGMKDPWVWLRVDELRSDTIVWMYWTPGVPAGGAEGPAPSAWSREFAGVWRLDETDEQPDAAIRNACRAGTSGVSQGTAPAPGLVGRCRRFNGAGSHIAFEGTGDLGTSQPCTLSAWVRLDSARYHAIIGKMAAALSHRGYDLAVLPDGRVRSHLIGSWPGDAIAKTSARALSLEVWHHVAMTYDGTGRHEGMRLYLDGAEEQPATPEGGGLSGSITNALPLCLGIREPGDGASSLHGCVDEARIARVERSPDWIRAAWLVVVSNETFASCGDVEIVKPVIIGRPSARVAGSDAAALAVEMLPVTTTETFVGFGYGESDGGTNAAAWERVVLVPACDTSRVEIVASGLTPGRDYACRAWVSNEYGVVWSSEPTVFMTAPLSIHATRTDLSEGGPDGRIRLERPATASRHRLEVTLRIGGTAKPGRDYEPVPETVSVPAGTASVEIPIRVMDDETWDEGVETMEFALAAGGYLSGMPARAEIRIADNDTLDPWAWRASMVFTNLSLASPLAGFPALIQFGTNIHGFAYDQFASPPWHDLRFVPEDGSGFLPYAVDSWDTGGTSRVWVRLPELRDGAAITAYWGRPDTPAGAATNGGVWAGYSLVLPFSETNGVPRDASPAQRVLTVSGSAVPGWDTTRGPHLRWTGGLNDVLLLPADDGIKLGPVWTVGGWFRKLDGHGQWRTLFCGPVQGGPVHDHQVLVEQGSHRLGVYQAADGSGFAPCGYDLAPPADEWHHVVAVGREGRTRFFVDGRFIGTAERQSRSAIGMVGNYAQGGQRFAEYLDDVRIAPVARSDAWIRAEWMNWASNRFTVAYHGVRSRPHAGIGAPASVKNRQE